jgi:hypothetical protein
MNKKLNALCWAAAIFLVALGGRSGLMDKDAVVTLLWVLPVLAWLSITGRMSCSVGRRDSQHG